MKCELCGTLANCRLNGRWLCPSDYHGQLQAQATLYKAINPNHKVNTRLSTIEHYLYKIDYNWLTKMQAQAIYLTQ